MNVTRIGLDLAKQVFQVHGVNASGKTVLRKTLRRQQVQRNTRAQRKKKS